MPESRGAVGRGDPGRRRSETGAASLEYAGFLFVILALLVAMLVVALPAAIAIRAKICEAVGASCGSVAGNALPTCITSTDLRTLAFGGNLRIYNADRKDGDNLSVNADGSASFSTSQSLAAGVGTGKTSKSEVFSADAKIQLVGESTYVYNVPKDWGGAETARALRDSRNSTLSRYGRLVVGPLATSVEEGATRVVNGVGNGVNSAWDWVTGDEESPEEREARERSQSLQEADAIRVSLGLQGEANVSAESDLIKGGATGKASAKGEVTVSLNRSGADKAASSFSGVVALDGEVAATLGIPGQAQPGQPRTGDIPPFLQMAMGAGKTWTYTVEYDDNGEPSKLTLKTESRDGFNMGIAGDKGKKVNAGGAAKAKTGSLSVDQTVLDLTVPENRAAFDDLFVTYGVGIDGHQAQVSQMQLFWPPEMLERLNALQDRISSDAINVRYEYETSGSGLEADGGVHKDGFDLAVVGVSWEDSSENRRLTSAVAHDYRLGGVEVPLVAGCGR
jgi:hypothetical protein